MRGKNIDENKLDELMRSMLMEEKGDMNETADFIFSQDFKIEPPAVKVNQLITDLSASHGKSGFASLFPVILSTLFVLVTLFAFFISVSKKEKVQTQNLILHSETENLPDARSAIEPQTESETGAAEKILPKIHDSLVKEYSGTTFFEATDSVIAGPAEKSSTPALKESSSLPELSEEEKKRFRNIKDEILKKLVAADKKLYTHVDADKFKYKDSTIILDAFTIRNITVTNLEYKTFLADLIMQGRKEEYQTAKVNQSAWNKYGHNKLALIYFNDERYNDFPVVNISVEAARLFCAWLEKETQLYFSRNKIKSKPLHMRLPSTAQWTYSAWAGYAKIPYGTGYNTIFDKQENFVGRDYVGRMQVMKRKGALKDTLYQWLYQNVSEKTESEIETFINLAFSRFSPLPADTIYPQRMKAYSRFYHVSEIVPEYDSEKIWLTGVSWKNEEEYKTMHDQFQNTGVSPFVGFRFIIINEQDSEYKNPFW